MTLIVWYGFYVVEYCNDRNVWVWICVCIVKVYLVWDVQVFIWLHEFNIAFNELAISDLIALIVLYELIKIWIETIYFEWTVHLDWNLLLFICVFEMVVSCKYFSVFIECICELVWKVIYCLQDVRNDLIRCMKC